MIRRDFDMNATAFQVPCKRLVKMKPKLSEDMMRT